jgi:hypothetical protein
MKKLNLRHPPRHAAIFLVLTVTVMSLLASCAGLSNPSASPSPTHTLPPATETPLPPTATFSPPTETPSPIPATPTSTLTALPSDTPTETETATSTMPPPTPSGEDAIYVYYIQLNTGGPVACGDSLVAANTGLWRTGDIEEDVRTALGRLFFKRQWFGNLFSPVYLSNLAVAEVTFDKYSGEISVSLKGTYVRSDDRCDNGRVRAQIWTTIRQFKGIKTVYILLNDNLLGDILATE